MLKRTPLVFLAAFLVTVSLTVHAQAAAPRVCAGTSVDSTSPELRAVLANARSYRALGAVQVTRTEHSKVETQQFEATVPSGPALPVTVTCSTTGGCTAGCALTGCNLITVLGSPACSAVSCVNPNGGLPCGIQNAVCNKSETSTPPPPTKGPGTSNTQEGEDPQP